MDEGMQPTKKRNILQWLDSIFGLLVPNFNLRAVIYLTVLFGIAMSLQEFRISSPPEQKQVVQKKETIIADQPYWDSNVYKDRLKNQTVESFTKELQSWLEGKSQEFAKRRFEDALYINAGLDPADLPRSFQKTSTIWKIPHEHDTDS